MKKKEVDRWSGDGAVSRRSEERSLGVEVKKTVVEQR